MSVAFTFSCKESHSVLGVILTPMGVAACAALAAPIHVKVEVVPAERMPAKAMSLAPVVPTRHVLCVRHHLQVCRIAATPDTAKVVEFKPFWDEPYEFLVDQTVDEDLAAAARCLAAPHPRTPVPVMVKESRPQPARIGFLHLSPEAVGGTLSLSHARPPLACVDQTVGLTLDTPPHGYLTSTEV